MNKAYEIHSQLHDLVEVWGNGAIIVEPRVHRVYGDEPAELENQPVRLEPGDDLLINGKTCYVGSDRAYNAEYGRRSDTAKVWINRAASMIVAGTHPDKDTIKIKIKVGQLCLVEGNYYRIGKAMNDNFTLEEES